MEDEIRIEDFLKTEKQRDFEHDFFKGADEYEKWEDVDFDGVFEMDRTFTVEVEDIKAYSEGILDDNPFFEIITKHSKKKPKISSGDATAAPPSGSEE